MAKAPNPAEHDALIGRQHEIDELADALADAFVGRGRLVLLTGEPGIGKTRLAAEIATRAAAKGAKVAWGRCWEGGGAPAYWPWIQVLRESIGDPETGLLGAKSAPGLNFVVQMLPELRSSLATSDPTFADSSVSPISIPGTPEAPEPQRFRLFDTISTLLRRIAAASPLMIILDDLHAADTDSLLLLKFVARDLLQSSILLVGTYRESEVRQSPAQAAILAEVAREGRAMSLRGLTEVESGELVRRRAGGAADPALFASLHRATEGNPFFLDEIVRLMVAEHGSAKGRLDARFTIPRSVRSVVRRSLTALPTNCQLALTAASVIGHEFDLETLSRVTELSSEQMSEALDDAKARGIVEEAGGPGRYRFSHAIIPEALRADIGGREIRRLHQQIAEAIEDLHHADLDSHLATLAYHYSEALPGGRPEKVVEYSRRGAQNARLRLAYEESARLNQMALQALAMRSEPNELELCELLLALGEAQGKAGNADDARQNLGKAADIARRRRIGDLFGRAALEFSNNSRAFFAVDSAVVALLEESLALIGETDSGLRASLMARLAEELRHSDHRDRAVSLCRDAVMIARRTDDTAALVSALWTEHNLYWGPENLDKRLTAANEIAQLAERAGYTEWVLKARELRLSALFELGDIAAADLESAACATFEAATGQTSAGVERFRATRALLRGDFEQAELRARDLLREAQRRQDTTLTTTFSSLLLMLRSEQGRFDELEPTLKGATVRFPALAAARCSLALLYARMGRESEARAEFEYLAADSFARIARDWNFVGSVAIVSEVCAVLGDSQRAAQLYELLQPYAGRNVTLGWGDICYGSVERYLGMLAAAMQRYDTAQSHFEDALGFELKMGARPFEARTRVSYARMLLDRGQSSDRNKALLLLEEALQIASLLSMAQVVEEARALIEQASAEPGTAAAALPPEQDALSRAHDGRMLATVMFLDIVDSTKRTAELGDRRWGVLLQEYYGVVRRELARFQGREVNTFGDDFFAWFGAPAQAVRCACAIRDAMRALDLQIRAGLHVGECELAKGKVAGIAVHIGARVVRQAEPGEVMVSNTVKDLVVGAGISFTDRGIHALKGVPGEWRLFAAV